MPKRIALAGASGSIGSQTMEVCRRHSSRLTISLLSVHTKTQALQSWIEEFAPDAVCVTDPAASEAFTPPPGVQLFRGPDGLAEALRTMDYDLLVNGIVGAAGLAPSYHALATGRHVATANKESLVIGGDLLTRIAQEHSVAILPIDSEHSAIWQCLRSGERHEVEKLWLTASGGPFRNRPLDTFDRITVEEALGHPTWNMGGKITIDSATMMNKGFEVIEACWLFGVTPKQVEVVIHPESILHSAVSFTDGSVIAQMGQPDMHLPIQYALMYPERHGPPFKPLDLAALGELHFESPDALRYPALALAASAFERGAAAAVVLNAANEIAVQAFLDGRVPFTAIAQCVAAQLDELLAGDCDTLDEILRIDQEARNRTSGWLNDHFDLTDHLTRT